MSTQTKQAYIKTATSLPALVQPIVLPETGFIRQKYILGDKKAKPPIPAIFPVCSSTWWAGIKKGIYPTPVKLAANVTAWDVKKIRALIDKINSEGEAV